MRASQQHITTYGTHLLSALRSQILGALLVCAAAAADDKPVMVDFLTNEEVTQETLERTKDSGVEILVVNPQSPCERCGLKEHDLILAVDDIRLRAYGEYVLALLRNPGRNYVEMTINRHGTILQLRITDLLQYRRSGFLACDERGIFAKVLSAKGISIAPEVKAGLDTFPARATNLAREWLKENPANNTNAQWLVDIAGMHALLANQDFDKVQPIKENIPVPFFQRLAKFYLAIADHNRNGEKDPDLKAFGETAEFCALFYPYPMGIIPSLGNIRTPDEEFTLLLEDLLEDPDRTYKQRIEAAINYINGPGNSDWEAYFKRVKAGLVEPRNYGGWMFFCDVVFVEGPKREHVISDLQAKIAEGHRDKLLLQYCLLAPKTYDGAESEVLDLLDDIYKESPFFAVIAIGSIAHHNGSLAGKAMERLKLNPQLTSKPSRFYSWLLSANPNATTSRILIYITFSGGVAGPDYMFREDPLVVKDAFQGKLMAPAAGTNPKATTETNSQPAEIKR